MNRSIVRDGGDGSAFHFLGKTKFLFKNTIKNSGKCNRCYTFEVEHVVVTVVVDSRKKKKGRKKGASTATATTWKSFFCGLYYSISYYIILYCINICYWLIVMFLFFVNFIWIVFRNLIFFVCLYLLILKV